MTGRQPGFWDVEERLRELSAQGDPLEKLTATVDFEIFRADLEAALGVRDRSKGGRPPFDGVLKFRMLVLQAMHGLSLAQIDCWTGSRVLCLLPDDSAGLVAARRLAFSLNETTRAAGLALDEKHFRAHVTIARKVPTGACRSTHWPEALPAPLPFTAHGFVLMESTRDPEGSRYKVIHAWPSRPGDM